MARISALVTAAFLAGLGASGSPPDAPPWPRPGKKPLDPLTWQPSKSSTEQTKNAP